MDVKESRAFLKGEMEFTPERMMRYIRSRARLSSEEDIEDILQNALILVTRHFDPSYPGAKLKPYCMAACNKAIAQNLERYHKVILKKAEKPDLAVPHGVVYEEERELHGHKVKIKTLAPGQAFDSQPSGGSIWQTTSLDSLFTEEDGRSADDVIGESAVLGSSSGLGQDPEERALMADLIQQIAAELPTDLHKVCFILKYVHGYKREDLISCLKMEAKSIDTIDKKIVRTLAQFKAKLDGEESKTRARD